MTAALLPLKTLSGAKSRLAGFLTESERRALVMAMADDVLSALVASGAFKAIYLLTCDDAYRLLARTHGVDIQTMVSCREPNCLNAELDRALATLYADRFDRALIIPGDVPTVQVDDIVALTQPLNSGVRLCRAASDGGTNALMLSPPAVIKMQFGLDSAARHAAETRRHGRVCETWESPSLSHDIDLPDDVAWLARSSIACRSHALAADFLASAGRVERRKVA